MTSIENNFYPLLRERATSCAQISQVTISLNWTLATTQQQSAQGYGLCFSPVDAPRTLAWPGTLVGRAANELIGWLESWDFCQAAVGAAVVNAVINSGSSLAARAQVLEPSETVPGHLAVFDYFAPLVQGANVVVIGSYPVLQSFKAFGPYQCIERRPRNGELPDSAAEFLLPQADWVFITASAIANKTLPRLLSLSRQAKVVLMGPSLPWMEEWADFGVDYLAGVEINDAAYLAQVVAEGGGTRIFGRAVHYAVLATGR
jgi:uncharacterized protein